MAATSWPSLPIESRLDEKLELICPSNTAGECLDSTPVTTTTTTTTTSTTAAAPSIVPVKEYKAVKTPAEYPLPGCQPTDPDALRPEQLTKYEAVLNTVKEWTEIPMGRADQNAGKKRPISDDERMWLTRDCLLRYLRASKWQVPEAEKRLLATLAWRQEYGVSEHSADYISPENETGKQVIFGYDNETRPCLYLNPSKQNTAKSDRQLQHLVYMLERTIDLMVPSQDTVALLINFKESSKGSGPSVSQGKQTLTILQEHYPERLGRALVSDLPWYVTTFFRLISPFIDPVTKSKMKFNENIANHIPAAQLLTQCGGNVEFQYDHEIYWPQLHALCNERRKAYRERWEKAGKKIGESEAYLRGRI